jgi:CRISPR/Cas system-associated protein Cas7 (RAMP superfamily)
MTPADDWVTGIKDGHYTKTMQVGNCTVRINRPILDDQERARREEQVIDALRGLIRKELENEH